MTTQIPATAEIEKWHRIRARFFPNILLLVWIRSERKTHNPAGVDSGTPDSVPPLDGSAVYQPKRFTQTFSVLTLRILFMICAIVSVNSENVFLHRNGYAPILNLGGCLDESAQTFFHYSSDNWINILRLRWVLLTYAAQEFIMELSAMENILNAARNWSDTSSEDENFGRCLLRF